VINPLLALVVSKRREDLRRKEVPVPTAAGSTDVIFLVLRRMRPPLLWLVGVFTVSVVGLSASGRTPFTCGALEAARAAGATTIAVVSVTDSPLAALVDHEIVVDVGPEVIAGSTRLKAGTAQKLVLNMISTIAMVRLGKTYGNQMVDVVATNDKLRARIRRIVAVAANASDAQADEALAEADGDARVAIVMLGGGVDVVTARARLATAGGNIRKALAG